MKKSHNILMSVLQETIQNSSSNQTCKNLFFEKPESYPVRLCLQMTMWHTKNNRSSQNNNNKKNCRVKEVNLTRSGSLPTPLFSSDERSPAE